MVTSGVKSPLKERLKKPLSMICFCVLFSISSLFIVALAYMQSCCNDHLQVEIDMGSNHKYPNSHERAATQKTKNTGEQEWKIAAQASIFHVSHFGLSLLNALSQSSHTVGTVTRMNLWFMILLNSVVVVTHPCSLYHVSKNTRRFSAFQQTVFFIEKKREILEIFSASRLHSLPLFNFKTIYVHRIG